MKEGFDHKKYVKIQSEKIREKFNSVDKLYLEIGGKLFDDTHASRVLPGFKSDAKISVLKELRKDLEIIYCINAGDIEKNKTRGEYGITYDNEVIKLINKSKKMGFSVNSVVITLYNNQVSVNKFIKKLERNGIKTYIHTFTKGYPTDVDTIVSEEGYGANPYIETTKKLILVNAPGAGSGKLATCLSQIYHENKRGINASYAKFETFPVWNLPLKHPVNIAYEAATADLKDNNMIDPFHLEKYGVTTVNYNRDIEMFPVLKDILKKVTGKDVYYSPTDMGVNMVGNCITDDEVVKNASKQEILRRYYTALCDQRKGRLSEEVVYKIELLMNKAGISVKDRKVIEPAIKKFELTNMPSTAIELHDGRIITGTTTNLLGPSSSLILNALKALANIDDEVHLISPDVIEPIQRLKTEHFRNTNPRLHTDEILIALSMCATSDEKAELAMKQLYKLRGCEMHSTVMLSHVDEKVLKRLGINITCEPVYK